LIEARRLRDAVCVGTAILFSLGGIAGFILIFARHMNVFLFILSPIILAVYQIPAVVIVALWKKRKKREAEKDAPEENENNAQRPPGESGGV
jgi:UDP-N-acetylmuramyl pentapeptide phosphotransferase/UDP-N-acetylglucosamine-1-phosphate transferase